MNCVAFLPGTASRVVLIAAFCLGASAGALAFTPTQAQRDACTPDAFRLCSSEIPDVSRVTACMVAKKASLSAPCRAVFAAAGGEPASQPRRERVALVHEHHHHYSHRVSVAHAHHHKAHWKRYAYYANAHVHHKWAGR
jgi:hypothetical protein